MSKKNIQPWRLSKGGEKQNSVSEEKKSEGKNGERSSEKKTVGKNLRSRNTFTVPTGLLSNPYKRRVVLTGFGILILIVLIILFSVFMCDCGDSSGERPLSQNNAQTGTQPEQVKKIEKKIVRDPVKKNTASPDKETAKEEPAEEYTGPPDLGTDIEMIVEDPEKESE